MDRELLAERASRALAERTRDCAQAAANISLMKERAALARVKMLEDLVIAALHGEWTPVHVLLAQEIERNRRR